MRQTHPRLIVVGDRSLRVQGDFGGGYTEKLPPGDAEARKRAIERAVIYMPHATLIDCNSDAMAELKAICAPRP